MKPGRAARYSLAPVAVTTPQQEVRMSIFGTIMAKVFGGAAPAEGQAATPAAAPTGDATPAAAPAPSARDIPTMESAAGSSAAPQAVDVEAVLVGLAASHGETLNWRQSIVDLMKLLGLDSSLAARKELAGELHYTGDMNDSASMNIWLHKQVMQKLAENGGKVPDSLRA
jgi:Domain of unknown function (DUF3597)